ncbi:MAG: FIST C-terminal domain-containing protein, partial [Leptospiraceae bacterium]|nr:FIST C-terminal domain-containing protein [Leptospiraceae bacterium]
EGEKVIILFSDGSDLIDSNAQDFLSGINDARPNVPIAGGRAANALCFEKNFGVSSDLGETYIFTEKGILTKGAVGASITGSDLLIHRDVNLGWKSIGKTMYITKLEPAGPFSKIIEIDGISPLDIYRKYFGDEVANAMPLAGLNFPFVTKVDELEIAATPFKVFDDGSIIYTAKLNVGDGIKFGFGEPGLILHESMRIAKTILEYPNPIEGLFVYSCATRRKQLSHVAANELIPFQNIAPISGFLTGGEFYHVKSQNLAIGQTMTILSLSEKKEVKKNEHVEIKEPIKDKALNSMLAIQTLVERMTKELEEEQDKSEKLLLNILPESIARRLKTGENTIAERFNDATVLFADIVGFTELSSKNSPEKVVEILNKLFSAFDSLVEKYKLEKIKTIGDAYMVAGGIPIPIKDHALRSGNLALDMLDIINDYRHNGYEFLNIRIGLHKGPIVAGVLGSKKFAYDLWGDTVNIASRMESSGEAGKIQVSEAFSKDIDNNFLLEERGEVKIKGKGMMNTFFLSGRKI